MAVTNGAAAGGRSPAKGSPHPDPVGAQRFKLTLGSVNIGHFEECSGIGVELELKDYSEGGNNAYVHRLPTRMKYTNLVLKRGVTHEAALLDWFFKARTMPERSDVTVELVEPGGQTVRAWTFAAAYPVKWTGPTLNAGSNGVAQETLELAHSGLSTP